MKYLIFLLPLFSLAQPNMADVQVIEKQLKIDKRHIDWHLYTEQRLKSDTLYKLIAFPLTRTAPHAEQVQHDAYILLYNPYNQKVESAYIAENEWKESPEARIQGIELNPNEQLLGKRAIAYEVKIFYSNNHRTRPHATEQLLFFERKGKKLKKIFTAQASSYIGQVGTAQSNCSGSITEERSAFSITDEKERGYYIIKEEKTTKTLRIVTDSTGFCTEQPTGTEQTTRYWRYKRKSYHPD
ncbi:hypothetical protein [Capnocytophaga leadbetteri]|uniref:hypothetical protein n=1 Tax=Capnocytophaga leadbetteri TaxID=327575 RepID=UPI0028E28A16|nr:hypothetical protein [Capnocytophaga leadbetteri]